jgi:hypothetical protein
MPSRSCASGRGDRYAGTNTYRYSTVAVCLTGGLLLQSLEIYGFEDPGGEYVVYTEPKR